MRLEFEHDEKLPKLAWIAIADLQTGIVEAIGGNSVVYGDTWIFEGAWAGRLADGEFCTSRAAFGSGIVVNEQHVVLSPPTSTLECVFYYRHSSSVWAMSNTAAGLLEVVGDAPQLDRVNYLKLFETARFGLGSYLRKIPMNRGNLCRALYHPIAFSRSKDRRVLERPEYPDFRDFQEYRQMLSTELAEIITNATDEQRPSIYRPLSTISSGYDSPVGAVLAKEHGCRATVSFKNAREQFDSVDDSGEEIARYLGLQSNVFDRLAYRKRSEIYEDQFLASGLDGEDIVFASFGDMLNATCVFSGFAGDKIWGIGDPDVGLPLVRGDNGGGSMQEFRITEDFVHVPIPFIGALRQSSILRISLSTEMSSWRVGGEYDRPIARRIVEEAGVDRKWFGRTKKAVTEAIGSPSAFSFDALHPLAAREYEEFLRDNILSAKPASEFVKLRWSAASFVIDRLIWRRHLLPLDAKRFVNMLACWVSIITPMQGKSCWLYQWAVQRRMKVYRKSALVRALGR